VTIKPTTNYHNFFPIPFGLSLVVQGNVLIGIIVEDQLAGKYVAYKNMGFCLMPTQAQFDKITDAEAALLPERKDHA